MPGTHSAAQALGLIFQRLLRDSKAPQVQWESLSWQGSVVGLRR